MQAAECFVQLFTNLVTYLKPALSETSSPGTFSLHFSSNNSCSSWAVCLVWPSCRCRCALHLHGEKAEKDCPAEKLVQG